MLRSLWPASVCLAFFASLANADDPAAAASKKSPPAKTGLCKTVGEGGVGESGATSLVHHKVTGGREIIMVVRNAKTSLCPNTGAVAMLIVNGEPAAHGVITKQKNAIQANAKPGDHIIVIVHAIPLFNNIACVRLGELEFTLEQCELE